MLISVSLLAAAIAQARPPIATDRPDFTEGARAVPANTTQIETGITYERTGGDSATTLPEALIRHSLASGLEARINPPNFASLTGSASESGLTDLTIGFKLELNQNTDTDLALIAQNTFPTGDAAFRASRNTPALALAWATEGIAGLIAAEFPGGAAQFRNTLVVGRPLDATTNLFAEHVLDFSETMSPAHTAHFGLTRALGNDAQLDFHFGIGLTRTAPDFFIGAGYSVRF